MELVIYDRVTNRKYNYFTDIKLQLKFDSVGSVFSFSMFYDPENPDHKLLTKPSSWQLAKIYENGELLLTGFILQYSFLLDSAKRLVSVSGYSIPGVLEDSQIPLSAYPLQNDNLNLRQIAEKILLPFQIKIKIDDSVSSEMELPYSTTTSTATSSVKDYLTELAKQRNIIISHTEGGRLLFTRTKTDSKPVAHFDGGYLNTEITHSFNGQVLHSPITVVKQADADGGSMGEFTIKNPYIPESTTAFRPKVIVQSSGDDNDTEAACKNALLAELKAISVKINLSDWYVNDVFMKPNTVVTVQSDELWLFDKVKLFVESVDYSSNSNSRTCTLNCVLPEVYSGEIPNNIYENR